MTVREYVRAHDLSPTGYNPENDEEEVEQVYHTRAGDEMIVYGLGEGRIINPAGAASVAESGPLSDYLSLENNRDWIEDEI